MVEPKRGLWVKSDFWTDFGIFLRISGEKMVEIRAAVYGRLQGIQTSLPLYTRPDASPSVRGALMSTGGCSSGSGGCISR
jgi:hypothetical protein